MTKYKISCVNYLNSLPFVKGLTTAPYKSYFDLSLDFPAESARKAIANEVDIALVPVAILPDLKDVDILDDYGIACNGKVSTVQIFSHLPISELKVVLLDYQSRTSVLLSQLLIENYWNTNAKYQLAHKSFQKDIYGDTGGLVIGDRAIRLLGEFPYAYDLGEAWKDWTRLPFTFAVWIYRKDLPREIKMILAESFEYGLGQKEKMIDQYTHLNTKHFSVSNYLNNQIIHKLSKECLEGKSLFLDRIK